MQRGSGVSRESNVCKCSGAYDVLTDPIPNSIVPELKINIYGHSALIVTLTGREKCDVKALSNLIACTKWDASVGVSVCSGILVCL